MRLRASAALVALVASACGGGSEGGGLPAGGHVHSLGVTDDGGLLLGLHGSLYRSADGDSWEPAGLQGEDAMVIAAASETLFVAGHEVLYRSDDGGDTFTPLRPSDLPGLDIHAFAQAPTDGGSVYAYVVGHGLFWSGDEGDTWEPRVGPDRLPRDLSALAVVGSGTDTLVLVGPESGILRSQDGGRSLVSVAETPAWAVAVDPADPQVVWAVTSGGVARSGDGGETWETVSALPGVEGQPVALAAGEQAIWLVTEEPRALYQSADGGRGWEQVPGR